MMDQALQDRARALTTELAALALVCEKWGWWGFAGLFVAYWFYYAFLLGFRPGYVVFIGSTIRVVHQSDLATTGLSFDLKPVLVPHDGPAQRFASAHLRRLWILWKRWRS